MDRYDAMRATHQQSTDQRFWTGHPTPLVFNVSNEQYSTETGSDTGQLIFQPDPQQEGHFRAVTLPCNQHCPIYDAASWNVPPCNPYEFSSINYNIVAADVAHPAYPSLESQHMPRTFSTSSTVSDSSYVGSPVSEQHFWYSSFDRLSPAQPVPVPVFQYTASRPSSSSSAHSPTCANAGKKDKTELLRRSKGRSSPQQIFLCKLCPQKFRDRPARDAHRRSHDETKTRVKCERPGCNKWFGRQADASRHVRNVHDKEMNPHPCRYCGKNLSRSDTARRHENGTSCKAVRAYHARSEGIGDFKRTYV